MTGFGFTYAGEETQALTDVALSLPAGSMTAVLGPVGSGTSTLARALAGLLGARGTSTGHVGAAGTVGLLGDDPEAQLSGMTSHVEDEVQLACRLRGIAGVDSEERARTALARLGIDGLWARRLDTLSGGQRQLVALSRITALDPDLLILDQPSQSLDPDMRRGLAAALRETCGRGRSVLITGHQIDELALSCHEVRFLDAGRLKPAHVAPEDSGVDTDADADPDTEFDAVTDADAFAGTRDELGRSAELQGVWDTRPVDPPGPVIPTAPVSTETVLKVRDFGVDRAGTVVLKGVDFDLHPGELSTLTGANGAGKSTLLRGLIGLLDRSADCAGTVTASRLGEGTNLLDLPAHVRSAHLGWVGQDPGVQLSAATVRSELMRAAPLPRHRRRDRPEMIEQRRRIVDTALDEADLAAVCEEHPFDLDTPRRKDLVIASALVTGAEVLLLDEPTIGRDRTGMDRLSAIIDGFLARGGAVLATTHDHRWAQESSHRRFRLADGRVNLS
ncbi:ATP-binding cassette domain-containing protein [Brevibacterium sp. VCM10]|uniref:ATP-binding cassette domain-containing protein n=1 Tax=Brevibacterium sp. VCM10 TaxID=1381751 RepID=UPI0012DBD1B7|nr:ABC transporter ATP-binding protein [Brevibacterium sp. VCM10]